jgi:L-alanine-DL-glutamate epimerase-like enolase superfamily enzyme
MARQLTVSIERFRIAGTFTIARGSRTEALVVVVTLTDVGQLGRGECVPYSRYGETVESVVAQIEALRESVQCGLDRHTLQKLMPAGAARNAIDCALWDLDAKLCGLPAYQLAGLSRIAPVVTAFTISLGSPAEMASAAALAADRPLLKIKLGGIGDPDRIAAVRAAAPDCELIVDANESWRKDLLRDNFAACLSAGVRLVEQPLPDNQDALLLEFDHPLPVCADESLHDRRQLAELRGRYEAINVKLDKAGGLTEALALSQAALDLGLHLVVGCMVATSLAMAPAMLLTPKARFVDLDGPLLLEADRPNGLKYDGSIVSAPQPALWG